MLLTRYALAKRWGTSVRTVDRRKDYGLLPWIDLAGGRGNRPMVRFQLSDVERYEEKMKMLAPKEKRQEIEENPRLIRRVKSIK